LLHDRADLVDAGPPVQPGGDAISGWAVGGMLVGIGFAVMSRTAQADRTFGYLLVVQFDWGSGLAVLPPWSDVRTNVLLAH
jgi:hypothetical protein